MRVRPDITIVMCTYNRAQLLAGALESVIKLKTRPQKLCEVVVIDDGSTDRTPHVIAAIADETSVQVRHFRQKNAGIGAARNRGVREAHGAWIAFIDDDEVADPEWLNNLYITALREDADCVGGPVIVCSPSECPVRAVGTARKLLGENPAMMNPHKRACSILGRKVLFNPGTGNALVKRSVFERVGKFDESLRFGEDTEFFSRVGKVGCKVSIAPKAIVYHRILAPRLTTSYLLPLARKAGEFQCRYHIRENGYLWYVVDCFGRLLYSALCTLPLLITDLIRGDRSWTLSRRCSLQFTLAYMCCLLPKR